MSQIQSAVRSLLLPIEEATLLLPSTVVAEIVPYSEPVPPPEGVPNWLLGSLTWRELRIPLLSVDVMLTGDPTPPGRRARVAVLKALGNRPNLPYYGIVTVQLPHLVTIAEGAIEPLDDGAVSNPMVAAEVLANGEPALIPNVDLIEMQLYRALIG